MSFSLNLFVLTGGALTVLEIAGFVYNTVFLVWENEAYNILINQVEYSTVQYTH